MDKTNTQMIIVDLQEKLLSQMPSSRQLKTNIKKLIKSLKILGIPITTTSHKADDRDRLPECILKLTECNPMEKTTFSCMRSKEIIQKITDTNRKNVIICGIESHICIYLSAMDLKAQGYNPVVVSDCIASRKKSDHKAALKALSEAKIPTPTMEMLIFGLMEKSDIPEFDNIIKIIQP